MGMMIRGINGRGFDLLGASAMETVNLDRQEVRAFRNTGLFLYPCHMLEHEDNGPMRNPRLVA